MSRLTDQPVNKYVALSQVSIYVAGAHQTFLNKFEHLETSMKKSAMDFEGTIRKFEKKMEVLESLMVRNLLNEQKC